jgi:pyruvate kinase
MSFLVKSKTEDSVKCEVVDGGELKSRRHLNVRGKSATLPSITGNGQHFFFVYYIKFMCSCFIHLFRMCRQGLG